MIELILLIVVATSIWVFFDAPQHGISRMAALASLLVWIVGFPLYLADRSKRRHELAGARLHSPGVPPPPSTPPGWYPDPYGTTTHRWWDGYTWTEHARSHLPPPPPTAS